MKFSSLFRMVSEGVEMEVYRDNPGQYLCSVTSISRVPRDIFKSEVKSITPVRAGLLVVIVGREKQNECKNQSIIQRSGGASRFDSPALSCGEVVEGKATEREV